MTRSEIQAFLLRLSILTAFVAGLWLAFQAREILGALMLAGLTAVLVNPLLSAMERKRIPSAFAILFLMLGALLLLLIVGAIIFPLLAEQFIRFESVIRNGIDAVSKLAASPESLSNYRIIQYLERANVSVDLRGIADFAKENLAGGVEQISKVVTTGSKSFFGWIFGLFGAFSNIVLYLVFLVFILMERRELFQNLTSFLPKSNNIDKKAPEIQRTLLSWWRGQAILSAFIGGMTLVVLVLLDWIFNIRVEHHVSLAVIAGICEFIPVIGPLIALIPALLIGMQGGWVDAVVLIVAYVAIQQTESLYLVPKVHGKGLRLSDLEVLVWMTLSGTLFGIIGILFTLPVLAVSKILLASKKHS